jgi:hypothetical protein
MSPKKQSNKKELVGHVAVDSGQLMVCDPCYIDGEWKKTERLRVYPVYIAKDGRRFSFEPAGREGVEGMRGGYDVPIPGVGIPSCLIASGEWKEEPRPDASGEFSYQGACDVTLSNEMFGQLKFSRGHAGAGVAFSSGYGDGYYPVYARRNNEGRIIRVEIDMS